MKRALFASLVATLLSLTASGVAAPQLTTQITENNRLTLGAEWFRETIRNQTAGVKGEGSWGGVVAGYDYKEAGALYGGGQVRWSRGRVGGQCGNDWNVVGRIGYGSNLGAPSVWYFAPYTGVGYERQRIRFVTPSKVYFWYIPVGILLDCHFTPQFLVSVKAELGFIAGAHYRRDNPSFKVAFSNRMRYEVELPITYIFTAFTATHLDISLVPFWHGWRTGQKIRGTLTAPQLVVDMYGARLDMGLRF